MRETAINLFLLLLVTLGCVLVSRILQARYERGALELRALENQARVWESSADVIALAVVRQKLEIIQAKIRRDKALKNLLSTYFQQPSDYLELKQSNTLMQQPWELHFDNADIVADFAIMLEKNNLFYQVQVDPVKTKVVGSIP